MKRISDARQKYFNSRPHEEVDQQEEAGKEIPGHFNSRPHEEVDPSFGGEVIVNEKFQLTTSRRGRQNLSPPAVMQGYFNSRPHEEVDRRGSLYPIDIDEFQLTTSRRGRRPEQSIFGRKVHFNSRPHEEVDTDAYKKAGYSEISTHDLTKRSTVFADDEELRLTFQLTTSRRGRLSLLLEKTEQKRSTS